MANDFSTFMNTVAGQFTELSMQLRPHAAYLAGVHINPPGNTPAAPNATIRVPLVGVGGNVVDAMTAAPGTQDITMTSTDLRLTKMATKSFKVTSYEMNQMADSPSMLNEAIQNVSLSMLEYINGSVAALFVPGTFNETAGGSNIVKTTTGDAGDTVSLDEITQMRRVLSTRKIPLNDRGNLFLVTHPVIYNKWLADQQFAYATTLGDEWASTLRDNGQFKPQFNFLFLEDAQAPTTGTSPNISYNTAMFHRNSCVVISAPMEAPMGATSYRYANVFGFPALITFQYFENLDGVGGPYNIVTVRILFDRYVHRKNFCVLHTTNAL